MFNKETKVYFDLYFAKKIFENKKEETDLKALCLIYYLLRLYSESIDIALQNNFKEFIPFLSRNIPDAKLRKKIWLKIFYDKKEKENLSEAKKLISESKGIIKIEDILPLMGDNVKISEFKNELKDCISNYENSVRMLSKEIKEFNDSNDLITKDIENSKKNTIIMNYSLLRCHKCGLNNVGNKIFVFPCKHVFDTKCLVEIYKGFSKSNFGNPMFQKKAKLIIDLYKRIEELKEKKVKALETEQKTKEIENLSAILRLKSLHIKMLTKDLNKVQFSEEDEELLRNTKKVLYDYLDDECLLCGKEMINSTQVEFGDEDDISWEIC